MMLLEKQESKEKTLKILRCLTRKYSLDALSFIANRETAHWTELLVQVKVPAANLTHLIEDFVELGLITKISHSNLVKPIGYRITELGRTSLESIKNLI